jgi:hypothetical protein
VSRAAGATGAVNVPLALTGHGLHDPAGVAEVHVRGILLADALGAEALQFLPAPFVVPGGQLQALPELRG